MTKSNDFSEIVYGRRSIRAYNEEVKISEAEMLEMLEKATRAPSAVNMQSWRFVVVQSDESKETLRPFVGSNVSQNDTSAAMILIFGDLNCHELGEAIYTKAVDEGKMDPAVKEDQISRILPLYKNFSQEKMTSAVTIDAALVAMQLMLVARSHGYDTCPITGFSSEGLAEAFDLDADRYLPVIAISIGEATDEGFDTVRLDAKELTTFK